METTSPMIPLRRAMLSSRVNSGCLSRNGCCVRIPSTMADDVHVSVLDEPLGPAFDDTAHNAPRTYFITRRIFLTMLAAIFVVAFASLGVQITGLVGSHGIFPVQPYLDVVADNYGAERYRLVPTIGWLNASDQAITWYCIFGGVCAVLAMSGVLVRVMLLTCWVMYLSLFHLGRDFLGFQWDILLLETAFLAIFFAPGQLFPRMSNEDRVPMVPLWLLRWLLFRLMFSSGVVKLGDNTWRDLKALNVHYETQPLPTPIAWYVHQLPEWFQNLSVVGMFTIELIVPFFIFLPRTFRAIGCVVMVAFQLLIIATGNYCFFNWLTIALCMLLLDDDHWAALTPELLMQFVNLPEGLKPASPIKRAVHTALAVPILMLSIVPMSRLIDDKLEFLDPLRTVYRETTPFALVNSYGLFAHMTTVRPEIELQGSVDGQTWKPYRFKWKPGPLDARPRFVAPHQPRLDWQMWFAALSPRRPPQWFDGLVFRLLQGEPKVLALFAENPFPDAPPTHVRAVYYEYAFTDWETRSETGNWWNRAEIGLYRPAASLRRVQ